MKMKFSASILLLVAVCNFQSVSAERGRTSAQEENRALNDKWPPKNLAIPGNRRWHSWQWSGGATQNQLSRAGHRHPKSGESEEYYDDDDGYYYAPSDSKNNKRPSETKFDHMVKMPKRGKNEKGKGGGKGGKRDKGKGKGGGSSDDCPDYYYVYEEDYEHRRMPGSYESEEYESEEHYSEDHESEDYFDDHYEHDDDYEFEIDYEKGSKGSKSGGKYPKSRKSSKRGKKTKVCTEPPFESPPTVSPAPTGSNDRPSERPPNQSPSGDEFTPSPTNEDSIAVELPAFALEYDVPDLEQPSRRELDALQAATNLYLENFFFDEFDGNTFTILDDFITELLESNFAQGRPIEVDYLSTARFNPFSTIIPTEAQLNAALIDAFSGLNMLDYEVFLNEELPDGNVFIGSTVVFIQDDSGGRQDVNTRSGIAATSIAAAAVAFTLLVAGFVVYKRKQDREDPETDKLNKPSGDATVAGETFTGETYDGSAASISAASMDYIGRYRDEDETSKTVSNLGTIPESEDGDQAAQAWGNNSSSEDTDDEEANNVQSVPVASQQSNEAFKDGERIPSFEEVALQSFPDNVMQGSFSSSNDESQSQHSSFEHSLGKINSTRFHSTPSYDSNDGNTPSVASLSVRDGSTRRPRTVSEIEALLSAGVSRDDDDTVTSDVLEPELTRRTSRPRTVEEIENLLHADLEDDSVLELPFSDEDDTIGDV